MLPGADDDQQLSGAHVRGPRHLRRSRRGRHAARFSGARTRWPSRRYATVGVAVAAVGLSTTLSSSAWAGRRAGERCGARRRRRTLGGRRARLTQPHPETRRRRGRRPDADDGRPGTGRQQPARRRPARRPPPPASPTVPAPVGGLTQAEMNNAVAIIDVARQLNLPRRAAVVGIATALQESHLRSLAEPEPAAVAAATQRGRGVRLRLLGLFQQRPTGARSTS